MIHLRAADAEGYDEQLQKDSSYLCSEQMLDNELVDKVVLQLNRVYPQILSDKEACKFRNLTVPTKVRLHELLKHLYGKGEESCHEFYRALHIHAEDIYCNLPSKILQREIADSDSTNCVTAVQKRHVLNDKGSAFFLSCFSFVVGVAFLYYYGEDETMRCSGSFLPCSALRLSKNAKDVFILFSEDGSLKY